MKVFLPLLLLTVLLFPGHATADGRNEELPYEKGGNCDDTLVKNDQKFLKALKAIKDKTGRKPTLTSCRRSQARQNAIRQSLGCGANNCRGRAAKTSQHTVGTAADIRIQGMSGRGICDLLGKIRDSIGYGGVGAYGDGSGHLDMRPSKCAWNKCAYLGCSNEYISPAVEKYLVNSNIAFNGANEKDAG
ncbi:MAG: DUF882 domain-containing protein [Proteobacteria bacterium]|nr:MAG: DUF882 domain-containing protein [Pseudomonadota bacterium]